MLASRVASQLVLSAKVEKLGAIRHQWAWKFSKVI